MSEASYNRMWATVFYTNAGPVHAVREKFGNPLQAMHKLGVG